MIDDFKNILANLGEPLRSFKIGEGDCDSDLECNFGLRCGINNCRVEFSSNETNWSEFDDCCTGT